MTSPLDKNNTLYNKPNPSIPSLIEELTGIRSLFTIGGNITVSVEARNITPCPYFENLWIEYFTDVDIGEKSEVQRTIDFLFTKFNILFPVIQNSFGISPEIFLGSISKRLADQIKEAKQSGRKFTNGTVGSLKSINKNGDLILEKIPYWAFGSTNVSLDTVEIPTNFGIKNLREIMEEVGHKNENGEFYLPNSLGVSIMIQFPDGSIIGQKRNDGQVLTQYAGLTSSASGAVSIMDDGEGIALLTKNAATELVEEIGLETRSLAKVPSITHLTDSIQMRILKELGIDDIGVLVPIGATMERKRCNPEVVFIFVLPKGITLEYIQKKWENAPDKWESRGLVRITSDEIEEQIMLYNQAMTPELRKHPTGLEEYIKTLSPSERDWVGPHMLMSYLAWIKACEHIVQQFKERTLSATA